MSLLLLASTIGWAACAQASTTQPQMPLPEAPASKFFSAGQWAEQKHFESALNAVADPQRLRQWHDLLASEPHVAGTEGDERVILALADAFRSMGFDDVHVHEFWALLAEPVSAELEIIGGAELDTESNLTDAPPPGARRGVTALPITEDDLLNDPYVAHPGLNFGWNAYSGSGEVTAEVVYANYGTKEDFQTLEQLGVDCAGKIVLARYGGNFRGYKAKYAEQAGAAGLIIFTDPDDAGYRQGVPYPEGGWANDTCIQRGSIVSLDQPGDPLTPGTFAAKEASRLKVEDVNLPSIPVQPIGYRAAEVIMKRMTGTPLPAQLIKTWQGGLPCAYRLTGGERMTLRLNVQQKRVIKRSANVIATLHGRGADEAAQRIYIGSHHDAWGFGAGDPTSGTILVLEAARSFAQLANQGLAPKRTIVFCCWGAEEFGLIGSTEFCEQNREELRRHAMAYINLDAATMGPNFNASSDPLLKSVIEEAARAVPQAGDPARSVHEAWTGGKAEAPFRNLGGGSDHVGFYCHVGVPSCFISSGGAPGTAYHSNYDHLAWYRKTVGDDYQPALMLTRIVNTLAARLANADIAPLDLSRTAPDLRQHVETLQDKAVDAGIECDWPAMQRAIDRLEASAERFNMVWRSALADDDERAATRRMHLAAELAGSPWHWHWSPRWPDGMEGRNWFTNFYASSDPDSGYASWMLPELRGAIEKRDAAACRRSLESLCAVIENLANAADLVSETFSN